MPFAIWPAVSLQHQRGEEGRTRRVSEGSPRPSAPGVTLVKTKGKFGRTSCRSRRLGNRRRIPSICLSRFGRRCPFSTKEEKRVVRDESRKDPPGRPRRGELWLKRKGSSAEHPAVRAGLATGGEYLRYAFRDLAGGAPSAPKRRRGSYETSLGRIPQAVRAGGNFG